MSALLPIATSMAFLDMSALGKKLDAPYKSGAIEGAVRKSVTTTLLALDRTWEKSSKAERQVVKVLNSF